MVPRKRKGHFWLNTMAVSAVLLCATTVHGGFTTISAPISAGELNHQQILSGIYGGSFSASGVDFSNGSITATRIHDFDASDGHSGSLNLLANNDAGANDQIWIDGIALMTGRARYANENQSLGIFQGSDNTTTGFSTGTLLSINSNPFLGSGTTYGPTNLSGEWRWGSDGAAMRSSMEGDNADGLDHMVTYMITGAGLAALGYDADATVWLMFWDDGLGQDGDRDFNDLVVEVMAMAIPLPAPLAMAGIGILGLIFCRKKIRCKLI